MNEERVELENHIKMKDLASSDLYTNNHILREINEKYDKKQTKSDFEKSGEPVAAKKGKDCPSPVESLLKYSIELENERNTISEGIIKAKRRESLDKDSLNNEDGSFDVQDRSSSDLICDEFISDCSLLEDDCEENLFTINPSGSVLAPSPNPYNKLDKITEANLELTRNPLIKSSPPKVTFNDNITLLETSEDSDDDSYGNESTSSVDSKLVNSNDDSPISTVDLPGNSTIERKSFDFVTNDITEKYEPFITGISEAETIDNLDDSTTNRSVLLVKVPNTGGESSSKNCLDISSESENEDVCVGHSKMEKCDSRDRLAYSKSNNDDKSENGKNVNELIGNIALPKEIIPTKSSTNTEFNERLDHKGDMTNYNEEYSKIAEAAGITIKITCPDGTDLVKPTNVSNNGAFNELSDSLNSNSPVNSKTIKDSEAICSRRNKKMITTTVKSAIKLQSFEKNKHRLSTKQVRKKCFFQRNFQQKDENEYNTQNSRKKENKVVDSNEINNMNDSEILAEKIFKSLCHSNKSDESKTDKAQANNESISNGIIKQMKSFAKKGSALKLHSKSADPFPKRKKSYEEEVVCFCNQKGKERPKSSVVERRRSDPVVKRPVTAPAPVQRTCCAVWGQGRLPDYNGLYSEYGLSAEQLQERKRDRIERNKARKQIREEKRAEEERKRKENEERFSAWLVKKREQEKMRMIQTHLYYYQPTRLHLKNNCAPTAHLLKIGVYRKNQSRKFGCKEFSVEKLLSNVSPQEKRTYRIYLGLSTD